MNPTLRQIRSFVSVARLGSFTQAAKHLHLSQPALTVQIRQLEDMLGVQLFDRNTRSVALTRTGAELVPQLERLQEEMDAVLAQTRDVAAGRRGVVRLACIPSFASSRLPDAISAFRQQHPHITFSLKDANWTRVVAMVRSGEVDFGVADLTAAEPDLEFLPVMEDRMQVIYPATHPIATMKKVTLAALAQYPMVMMDPDTSARHTIDGAFASAGCYPTRACEVMYMATAVAMVRAGLGFTILPASAIEWRAHVGLAVRRIDEPAFLRRLGLIKRAGRSLPPASEAFMRELLGQDRSGRDAGSGGAPTNPQAAGSLPRRQAAGRDSSAGPG